MPPMSRGESVPNERMRVLWVYAHPDPRSLNGSLRDVGVETLRAAGHEVRQSDLYAMGWDPVVRADDYGHDPDRRLVVSEAAEGALASGCLAADVRGEQEKLRWADTVVVQFPLWWFGTPAILKGWFDRVFITGFAQGVRDPHDGHTLRYGNGGLAGKRALAIVTVGAPADSIGPRGIHGELHEVLFPLLHGTFWYTGMAVMPPFVLAGADRLSVHEHAAAAAQLREHLLQLPAMRPLPYRFQDGGDYGEDRRVLRADVAPGEWGLRAHVAGESDSGLVTGAGGCVGARSGSSRSHA